MGEQIPRTIEKPGAKKSRFLRWLAIGVAILLGAVLLGLLAFAIYRLWPKTIIAGYHPAGLQWSVDSDSQQRIALPGRKLIAVLANYHDELLAYLMFDFIRSRPDLSRREVLLTYSENLDSPQYYVQIECNDNVLTCAADLYELSVRGLAPAPFWFFVSQSTLDRYRDQTRVFVQAYNGPVADQFKSLSADQRVRFLRRFIRFKSLTDPRVRGGEETAPSPLTEEQAVELASDIIAVADFYQLPLEFMLGIGAMENNYLDVKGDLEHTTWKRRKDAGDIVVRQGRRRVLVRNPALGVWQITRETLRFAHKRFLEDKRDYSQLPERLRPDRSLDLDDVSPPVLTTYAGLLLRYLLDYFNGDIGKAVGAYNGGAGNPNQQYEAGVRLVADYARRILDRAAVLNEAAIKSVRASQH